MNYFVGTILPVVGNIIPKGWALCNGQTLLVSDHNALFSLIEHKYGGHGPHFNLPDLCGRVPIGAGLSTSLFQPLILKPGRDGGDASLTIAERNMPGHSHIATIRKPKLGLKVSDGPATRSSPSSGMLPAPPNVHDSSGTFNTIHIDSYAPVSSNILDLPAVALPALDINVTNSRSGYNQPFNIMNPYLSVNYIISLTGLMPQRP